MKTDSNFRITAAVVASALFMLNLDGSVVGVAIPDMARDLAVNPVSLSAAVTSYLVALTAFIPSSGWIADRFGARRVFMMAIFFFTIASIACAASQTIGQLVGARIVQGGSGALMAPVARIILFRGLRREDLLSATTWLTMPALIGPVLGPPLSGYLTEALSWRSVFWINLPVGLLGILMTWRFIPVTEAEHVEPPDFIGMLLIGVALTTLMLGIETLGKELVPPTLTFFLLLAGVLLLWQLVRHCRRMEHPVVDFSLLRIPTFHAATIAGNLFRAGAGAMPFLVPLTLQLGFGLSASMSGTIFLSSALGAFCMRPMTRLALGRMSMRSVLIMGSLSFSAMLVACATLSPQWPLMAIFCLLLAGGLSRSLSFAAMGALVFADVPSSKLSAATSFHGTAQQLMRAVGVAVSAGSIEITMYLSEREHAGQFDFAIAFLTTAMIVLGSAWMFRAMPANAGEGIAGAKRGAGGG